MRASREGVSTFWVGTSVEYIDSADGWSVAVEMTLGREAYSVSG